MSKEEEDVKYEMVMIRGGCHQRVKVSREVIEESMRKEEEPKMETCICKWVNSVLQVNQDCPLHKGVEFKKGEEVITVPSLREDIPPIELRIHGNADPELKATIEKAVKKGMEEAARCTCIQLEDGHEATNPDCLIHGNEKLKKLAETSVELK